MRFSSENPPKKLIFGKVEGPQKDGMGSGLFGPPGDHYQQLLAMQRMRGFFFKTPNVPGLLKLMQTDKFPRNFLQNLI